MLTLKEIDWGLIDYQSALEKQLELVEEVHQNPEQGFLIFCSHPPVVTLGRKTQPGDVFDWQGPLLEVSRGGRATYHGPSQLVVYPIFKLTDIHKYLRSFEQAIVDTLQEFRVSAVGKSLQQKQEDPLPTEETGVWVGSQKIASLGIGIKKWITYHGAAINLDEDPKAFLGMNPCGFQKEVMVSLEKLLGEKIDRKRFQETLKKNLLKNLS
jgi:lipoyl(octanoyl) transferase